MNKQDYYHTINLQIEDLRTLVEVQTEKCFDAKKLEALMPEETVKGLKRVIITGCGDSFSAAGSMKPAFCEHSGLKMVSAPDPMEFCRFYEKGELLKGNKPEEVLVIAVSASGGSDRIVEITAVVLSTGETVECDFVVCAAGVRPNIAWLEGSELEMERGITVDSHMRTSTPDVYAAGDVTGLSGVWPNAMDMGRIAASNMCGADVEYTDRYCMKNTSNFFGLQMLTIGDINAQVDGADIFVKESRDCYKKAVVKDGVLKSILIQGDISHTGHWQYLIKNGINLNDIIKRKSVFDITYGDFYGMDDMGEYQYNI